MAAPNQNVTTASQNLVLKVVLGTDTTLVASLVSAHAHANPSSVVWAGPFPPPFPLHEQPAWSQPAVLICAVPVSR